MEVKMKYTLEVEAFVETGKDVVDTSILDLGLLRGDIMTSLLHKIQILKTSDQIKEDLKSHNGLGLSLQACCSSSKIIVE